MLLATNLSTVHSDTTRAHQVAADLIDTPTMVLCLQVICCVGWIPTTACGVVSNIVNIVVFLKIGLTDPVNISFFALSISDFLYMLMVGAVVVCNVFSLFGLASAWVIHPFSLLYYIVFYSMTFSDASVLITTYIAVVRCCCIAMALKFKYFFTVTKTVVLFVLISLYVIATHLPVIVTSGFVWTHPGNRTIHVSQLTISRGKGFQESLVFHDIVNRNVLPYTCWIITIFCLVIIAFTLKSSSKFRNEMSSETTTKSIKDPEGRQLKGQPGGMSKKDVQVVRTVSGVCGLFVFCTSLSAFPAVARLVLPSYDTGGRFQNVFYVYGSLATCFTYSSAAANSLVYYNCNSRYRDVLRGWLAGGVSVTETTKTTAATTAAITTTATISAANSNDDK